MRNIITQTVELTATSEELIDMYLNPEIHETITGAPVTIGEVTGSDFSAFNGALSGTILFVQKPTLIVQYLRSVHFKPYELDSTLILNFEPAGKSGRINLVHLDVPDHDYDAVVDGWNKYYWVSWNRYLEKGLNYK